MPRPKGTTSPWDKIAQAVVDKDLTGDDLVWEICMAMGYAYRAGWSSGEDSEIRFPRNKSYT